MNQWKWRFNRWKNELLRLWRDRRGQKGPRAYSAHLKMCPSCGKFISSKSSRCEYCDAEVGHIAVRSRRGSSTSATQQRESVFVVFGICAFFFVLGALLTSKLAEPRDVGAVLRAYWGADGRVLYLMGASYAEWVLLHGEFWRLTTYMFLHANLIHIGFNMSALAVLGPLMVSAFGLRRFWLISFLTGILGAVCSIMGVVIGIQAFTVGYSGALFGFIGALWIYYKKAGNLIIAEKLFKYMLYGNLVMILVTFLGFPIDNLCHLGGMFSGIGLGWLMRQYASSPAVVIAERVLLAGCISLWGWGLVHIVRTVIL